MLYLSYLRLTSILFLIVGMWAIPNIIRNSAGDRYQMCEYRVRGGWAAQTRS